MERTLFSIRIEIREHVIYYIDLAMREGNYVSDEEQIEPDPYIGLLNSDLIQIEEMILQSLPPRKARFIFDGITELMATILMQNLRHIRQININGIKRLLSNVHALQQNLASFTYVQDQYLERCSQYFELLRMKPEEIMEFVEKSTGTFNYDQYKVILELRQGDQALLAKQLKEYYVSHRF